MATLLLLSATACRSAGEAAATPEVTVKQKMYTGSEVFAVPNATIFRMSGDFADNVGVTLNSDGTLAYYPDPTDLTSLSRPLYLGNGWYLNRQGLGKESVFTSYKFDQYRELKQVPSHSEILNAVIPGAKVTEMKELPVTYSEALKDPSICLKYIPQ